MTFVGFTISAERTEVDRVQFDSINQFHGMRRILPALQAYSFVVNEELENARRFAEQEVSLLPIHPFMSDSEVEQVRACNGLARSQT